MLQQTQFRSKAYKIVDRWSVQLVENLIIWFHFLSTMCCLSSGLGMTLHVAQVFLKPSSLVPERVRSGLGIRKHLPVAALVKFEKQ